jgi:hypothetical protein
MADDQIPVTNVRNSFFRRFLGWPEEVTYAKKVEEGGTDALTDRWFLRAATGHRGERSCAVSTTDAPSSLVDFVQGIWKLAEWVPSRSVRNSTSEGF